MSGDRYGRSYRTGFTLIELMIVVAIIGILAAIAIPKFADLVRKSQEGQAKGNLGSLRSALSIYYADMEGNYPGDFNSLTINGKYLSAIPKSKTPNFHPDSAVIRHNQYTNPFGCGSGYSLDTGDWIYWSDGGELCAVVAPPAGQNRHNQGDFWIACNHTDTKGSAWSSY
ncbi:MAG: prepilin-type N-terminal cleavage/methylation domain-containing protein [Elusimicrobiota bacterium]|jgi:general secretion pathway protein G